MSESKSSSVYVLANEASGTPFKAKVGGKTLSFTHIADVDQFALVELMESDLSNLSFVVEVFRLALDEKGREVLRQARPNRDALTSLFAAYKAHCGVGEGESTPSGS